MELRQYTKQNINGQRVLLRLDLDVEVNEQGQVDEFHDLRLERAVVTIKQLLDFGAAGIIMCGHRGRPLSGFQQDLSLIPVRERLEFLLNKLGVQEKINLVSEVSAHQNDSGGQLLMLENLRFWPGEKNNDANFAAQLSSWGEVYVNDGFGSSHRADVSLVAITMVVQQCFAGPNLVKEVQEQEKFLANVVSPLVVVLGGVKISTKLPLIKNLLPKAEAILLGGGLANTVLASRGAEVGQSIIEREMLPQAKDLNAKIVLPQDFTVLSADGEINAVAASGVSKTDFILDIGPKTSADYAKIIGTAQAALWNGPMGKFEDHRGQSGTTAVAQALTSSQAKTLVGGGDTVVTVERLGLVDKFGFVSVGGGAMLTFLAGESMPALDVLNTRHSERSEESRG